MRRALAMIAIGGAAAAAFVGCAFDWDFPADSSSGEDAGGSNESSLTDTRLDVSVPPADSSTGDTGPIVKSCFQSADCVSMKEYCHFADFRCGKDGGTGVCTAVPTACSTKDEVCACDGKTYASECVPTALGTDLARNGCPFDAGTQFQCGTHICDQDKEYCLVGTSPVTYQCKPPPVATGSCAQQLSCSCQTIIDLKCKCEGSPGEITLTCP